MHSVDIWRGNRNNDKLDGPFSEPSIVVGHGEPMLRIVPQVNGVGYGLTIMDMAGNVLLLADKTKPGAGILEVSETISYSVKQPLPKPDVPPMDEICPACGCVHQGFTPREGQHHTFWRCRRCNVDLYTIKTESIWGWEVHGEARALSLCEDLKYLRDRYDMLRSFGTFIYHPVLNNILKLTEDADSMKAFYDGLMKLHNPKDLPWNHSSTKPL